MLLVLLFLGGTTDVNSRSIQAFWNLGHIALFLSLGYLLLTPPSALAGYSFGKQAVIILCLALVLGGVVELIQATIGRSMDYADIARNTVGAILALVFFAPSRHALAKPARLTLQTLSLILFAGASTPFALAVWDEQRALTQWPVLANFEDRVQLSRWSSTGDARLSIAKPAANRTRPTMKVDFGTSQYAGANLDYFPRDWSYYQQLTIEIYNPATSPLKITCRIHDRLHSLSTAQQHEDRFNRSYQLQPGWNEINITMQALLAAPSQRPMDIESINNLQLFVSRLDSNATVYIGRIYLQ